MKLFLQLINQVESHVCFPQIGLKNIMEIHGTAMEAGAPFIEGRREIFKSDILNLIGEKYGKSAAQIALKSLV